MKLGKDDKAIFTILIITICFLLFIFPIFNRYRNSQSKTSNDTVNTSISEKETTNTLKNETNQSVSTNSQNATTSSTPIIKNTTNTATESTQENTIHFEQPTSTPTSEMVWVRKHWYKISSSILQNFKR